MTDRTKCCCADSPYPVLEEACHGCGQRFCPQCALESLRVQRPPLRLQRLSLRALCPPLHYDESDDVDHSVAAIVMECPGCNGDCADMVSPDFRELVAGGESALKVFCLDTGRRVVHIRTARHSAPGCTDAVLVYRPCLAHGDFSCDGAYFELRRLNKCLPDGVEPREKDFMPYHARRTRSTRRHN